MVYRLGDHFFLLKMRSKPRVVFFLADPQVQSSHFGTHSHVRSSGDLEEAVDACSVNLGFLCLITVELREKEPGSGQ